MDEQKQVSPLVKMGLELGPVLAFFVGYLLVRDQVFTIGGRDYSGFIVVTAAFIPLLLACTGLLWWLSGHLSRMQVMTAVLVVLFGGLSVWLNDERFFKIKPTIIYLFFAGLLGVGLLRGQSWLQYVMEGMMPLRPEGWMILTRRLALFFAGLALANEVVWRTMSTDAWVNFKTFGITVAMFLFFMAQSKLMQTHGIVQKD
ncbi:inner membrane-spanning protein YciB [Plastorhodobacter daqingensis]|uniref:Inner membrane-spanning protein YciB n=1 Tax=Plastorhodobacter daqingensis TaxID=1387281 RepID=A0ABW2UKX2_9RHOB